VIHLPLKSIPGFYLNNYCYSCHLPPRINSICIKCGDTESDTCMSAPVFHTPKGSCAQFNNKWNPLKPLLQSQMISAWKAVEEKYKRFQENCLQMAFIPRAVRCPFIYANINALQDSAKGPIICHEHYLSWLHLPSRCLLLSK